MATGHLETGPATVPATTTPPATTTAAPTTGATISSRSSGFSINYTVLLGFAAFLFLLQIIILAVASATLDKFNNYRVVYIPTFGK